MHLDTFVQKIKSLDKDIKKYRNHIAPDRIDINSPSWLEEAMLQSRAIGFKFAKEISDLNDEIILNWRKYSKEDIITLQNTFKYARAAVSYIGITISELSENNLIDAFFFLLLKSRYEDYRDYLLGLDRLINFARENQIDYKNAGKQISGMFEDYIFHTYFDRAML